MTAPANVPNRWQDVLAAEYAAVFGYGLVGAYLTDATQITTARNLQEDHRATRNALLSQIAATGATPVAASPQYLPAQPVTDVASAQRWALRLERSCETAYRYVLTMSPADATPQGSRQQALSGLTAAALAAATWRGLLTPAMPTEPFPGQ